MRVLPDRKIPGQGVILIMDNFQKHLSVAFALIFSCGTSLLWAEQTEIASWYNRSAPGVQRKTANGEIFDDRKLTCATKNDAFGTRLKVENLENGKSVICRVNDRGPHKRLKRRIDLTETAFKKISDHKLGLAEVSVTKVSNPSRQTKNKIIKKTRTTRVHKKTKTTVQRTEITEVTLPDSKDTARQEFLAVDKTQLSKNNIAF